MNKTHEQMRWELVRSVCTSMGRSNIIIQDAGKVVAFVDSVLKTLGHVPIQEEAGDGLQWNPKDPACVGKGEWKAQDIATVDVVSQQREEISRQQIQIFGILQRETALIQKNADQVRIIEEMGWELGQLKTELESQNKWIVLNLMTPRPEFDSPHREIAYLESVIRGQKKIVANQRNLIDQLSNQPVRIECGPPKAAFD